MKRYMCKTLFIAAALIVTFATAQAENLRKEFNHAFKVEKGHNLEIVTRFSDVDVLKNDVNEIRVEVYIELKDNKNGKKLFDAFNVRFEQNGKTAYIATEFPKGINIKDLDIHFKIFMPSYINLTMDVSYGNVYLSELTGTENKLKVHFGNFKADVIASLKNAIELAYVSSADIGFLTSAVFDVSYSNLNAKRVDDFSGRTAYSEFRIDAIDNLSLTISKFDEWELGEVKNMDVRARYSEFEINSIVNKIIFNGNFGELEVDIIHSNFEIVKIEASYTDCELNIAPNASYAIEAQGSFADIDVPDRFKGSIQEKSLSIEVNGVVGDKPKGKVYIDTSFGDVDF